MYAVTTDPDNHAGLHGVGEVLKGGERVARIELAYSAWKGNRSRRTQSRRIVRRRMVDTNRAITIVTDEAQIRPFSSADVAFLLYPTSGWVAA